ncbi:glycerate kinase type-2 family protein [Candidatus Uabimicrobium amorphum]|uniref:D-glycerate 2-kinase n=1 Tax=Uabimicrobium amorphum TaxID=2596890 RepID=A0A5S9F4B3_UABAM|nr:DUF4147 domain-containing protein [Candidatus Uabimicrobium amorphum]BBM84304.1 D-glycerate 2-kinase [Candidatus Uabimicrobium amorphum]
MTPEEKLQSVFMSVVARILPQTLIQENLKIKNDTLHIGKNQLTLPPKIHIFGSGKAATTMAKAVCDLIPSRIAGGVVVSNMHSESIRDIEVIESSHPLPTQKSVDAGNTLFEKMAALSQNDFFIYLLSGGTSALLEKLPPGVSLQDMQEITQQLLQKGADITQLNSVRKQMSAIKGGKLAQALTAPGIVLVISDVIGDDLAVIGSGPLYHQPYTDAQHILDSYDITYTLPKSSVCRAANNVPHFVIGNNSIALQYAREAWQKYGIDAHIMTSQMHGEAKEIAKCIVAIAKEIRDKHQPFSPPVCLIFGGETTVNVQGKGRGGRNQELALASLQALEDCQGIYILSAGTDGIDGNSDAAGAIVSSKLYHPQEIKTYLKNNDSYSFFHKYGGLLSPGKTGTNVMDMVMAFIL